MLVNRYPPHTDWTNKPKLTTRWLGPYLVINKNDDWYTLKNLVTNNEESFHILQIKLFHYDPNKVDPLKVAQKNSDEYIVDTIISHEGNIDNTNKVKFRVRWKDFSALEDTLEPWENLKSNTKLHEYLITIGKAKLIPYDQRAAYPEVFSKNKISKIAKSSKKKG